MSSLCGCYTRSCGIRVWNEHTRANPFAVYITNNEARLLLRIEKSPLLGDLPWSNDGTVADCCVNGQELFPTRLLFDESPVAFLCCEVEA